MCVMNAMKKVLTAYKNAGGDLDLEPALMEMQHRGKSVPGGACGFLDPMETQDIICHYSAKNN